VERPRYGPDLSVVSLFAALCFVLPVAVVLWVRARRDTSLWQLASDVPLAVALDLLIVLALSRFMTLERAALLSRALWLTSIPSCWLTTRKRQRSAWPIALEPRTLASALVLAFLGLGLSLWLSRSSNIWDRNWHIPLVSSVRGQQMPFKNVYEPRVELAYHYSGDALSAMLQAFSGDALHSALALSLLHDVLFGLLGAVVALLLAAARIRSLTLQIAIFLAMVLAGPLTLIQSLAQSGGYSIQNLFTLSYRPHVSFAYLLSVGFVAAVAGGVFRSATRVRLFPALLLCAAALVLTDETTLALLGLWLGVTWLYDPGCLAGTRGRGALVLGALALGLFATVLAYGGVLGIHAPRYPIHWVAPRAPGWQVLPEPLATSLGRRRVLEDLCSVLGVFASTTLLAVTVRQREASALALGFAALVLGSTAAFTCLDFNHRPLENHRWMTLPFLIGPLTAALVARPLFAEPSSRRLATLATGLAALCCALGVASTLVWRTVGFGSQLHDMQFGTGIETARLYDLNCRALTGARLGERAAPAYVEARDAYLWAGCHSTFIAGPATTAGGHGIKSGRAASGLRALRDVSTNMLTESDPLTVLCLSDGASPDPICAAARSPSLGKCSAAGTRYALCSVASAQRPRLTALSRPSPASSR
jgi:hypothetical protein